MIKLTYGVFWIILVLAIFVFARKNERMKLFRNKMISMWKCSLVAAVLSYVGLIIGSGNLSYLKDLLMPLDVFCQCLVGFAIAKSIKGYEPLPVTKAFKEHKHQWRELILMLVFGVVITIVSVVLRQFVPKFGEVVNTSNAIRMLHQENKWLLFFTVLSGAGIAEETVYRLIFLSAFWKLTNKKWLSIVLSSLLFGAYHLTPIDSLYKVYWNYPIYQFVSVVVSGIIFGYFYTKRGYETAVIGHTFSDWLPILIFVK